MPHLDNVSMIPDTFDTLSCCLCWRPQGQAEIGVIRQYCTSFFSNSHGFQMCWARGLSNQTDWPVMEDSSLPLGAHLSLSLCQILWSYRKGPCMQFFLMYLISCHNTRWSFCELKSQLKTFEEMWMFGQTEQGRTEKLCRYAVKGVCGMMDQIPL